MKTILIVSDTFYPEVNGVTNTLKHWISNLRDYDYNIKIIRPKQSTSDVGSADELTVKSWDIPAYNELKIGLPNYRKLKRAIVDWKPDVVYIATEGFLGLFTRIICQKKGIRCVSGFHTNFHKYGSYYKLSWFRNIIFDYLKNFHNKTDATLVPTQQQKVQLEKHGFKRVHVLSRGIDSTLFHPNKRSTELRTSWHINSGTNNKVILYVGRLANEKNIDLAIDCFREIQLYHPTTKMVIVGDGPLKEQLEINNPDIIFAGFKSGFELATYYASSDLFLFPSLSDTFGNVVLEAMASGLAVVGFDEAAIHEHSHNGHNNIAVPIKKDQFGNPLIEESNQKFIRAACKIFENPSLVKNLQLRSRQHIEQISWASVTKQLIEILSNECEFRKSNENQKQSTAKLGELVSKA